MNFTYMWFSRGLQGWMLCNPKGYQSHYINLCQPYCSRSTPFQNIHVSQNLIGGFSYGRIEFILPKSSNIPYKNDLDPLLLGFMIVSFIVWLETLVISLNYFVWFSFIEIHVQNKICEIHIQVCKMIFLQVSLIKRKLVHLICKSPWASFIKKNLPTFTPVNFSC